MPLSHKAIQVTVHKVMLIIVYGTELLEILQTTRYDCRMFTFLVNDEVIEWCLVALSAGEGAARKAHMVRWAQHKHTLPETQTQTINPYLSLA